MVMRSPFTFQTSCTIRLAPESSLAPIPWPEETSAIVATCTWSPSCPFLLFVVRKAHHKEHEETRRSRNSTEAFEARAGWDDERSNDGREGRARPRAGAHRSHGDLL